MDDDRLAQRLVAITQLAEQLDRGTLDLALKIVPVAWWKARLGTTAEVDDDVPEANGRGQLSPARGESSTRRDVRDPSIQEEGL
jgi:hypothetical protein